MNEKKVWYKHGWGLVAAILFFPYLLIWYAWAKSNWSKNLKIGITSVIAVIMVPFMVSAATTKPSETNSPQKNVVIQDQSESEAQKEVESKKATEEDALLEIENKAAEEAAQKRAEEEAAAVAKRITTSPTTPAPAPTPAPVETSNLPLKAICNDGSVSYQDTPSNPNYRGMCSGHDGIKTKLGRVL